MSDWLQALLAALLVAIPGYALAVALFPPGTLARGDRAVHSFALGVSAAALGGLALQVVLGLDRSAWWGLLAGLTLAAAAVARARRAATTTGERWRAPRPSPAGLLSAIALLVAIAVAGAAVAIAAHGAREQRSEQRFASLWAQPGGGGRIVVGVWNHGGPASYRLEVSRDGKPIESLPLRLGTGRRWHAALAARVGGGRGPLLITLYHGGAAYRSVALDRGAAP